MQAALRAATRGDGQALSSQGAIAVSRNGNAYDVAFSGGFATGGDIVPDLKVELSLAPSAPSGSFTITYDGQTSGAIAYSSDTAVMAANIQSALRAMSNIGDADVVVAYDAAASDAAHESYSVRFQGALAARNIADFTAVFGGLSNATVTPYEVQAGKAATGEEQQVTLTTTAREASYTLSLVHGGTTYTTGAISITGTRADAQAAVDQAFAGLAGAQVEVISFTGKGLALRFGGSLAGQDIATLTVGNLSADSGNVELAVLQVGTAERVAATPAQTVVVDFSDGATDLSIATGTGPQLHLRPRRQPGRTAGSLRHAGDRRLRLRPGRGRFRGDQGHAQRHAQRQQHGDGGRADHRRQQR